MEISRRHLQDTERAEPAETLIVGGGGSGFGPRITEILHADCRLAELAEHALPDAAEMQRQVDGLTRNQRRVLNKRMRKAAKK